MRRLTIIVFLILLTAGAVFSQKLSKTEEQNQRLFDGLPVGDFWSDDTKLCSVCDSIIADGNFFRIFNMPTYNLAFSARKTNKGKLFAVTIYIQNIGGEKINFNPYDSFVLWYPKEKNKKKKPVVLKFPLTPEVAAKKLAGDPKWKNAIGIALTDAFAKTQTRSRSNVDGSATVTDNRGNTSRVTGGATVNTTITERDERARSDVRRRADKNTRGYESRYAAILEDSIRGNTIYKGDKLYGTMYLPYNKKLGYMLLAVVVNKRSHGVILSVD